MSQQSPRHIVHADEIFLLLLLSFVHCVSFFFCSILVYIFGVSKKSRWNFSSDWWELAILSIVSVASELWKCAELIMLKYKYYRHSTTPEPTPRSISNHNSPGHSFKGSTSSLSSSTDGMSLRRKKKKAPPPPPLGVALNIGETASPVKVRLFRLIRNDE